MTAAIFAGAPRQPIIAAAVVALHAGTFLAIATDRIRIPIEPPLAPITQVLLPVPKPPVRPAPELPEPGPFDPARVEHPALVIPVMPDASAADQLEHDPGPASGPAGSGARLDDDVPPAIALHGDRLAALIDGCYPSASRRLDEEGRALVGMVIDANGRAVSWTLVAGTGYSRLDSALDCVVGRLRFQPGRRGGRAVVTEVQLPIAFRLD